MPNIAQHLQQLDDAITTIFIPDLLGRTISVTDCSLLALPCRFGGIGLTVPSALDGQNQSSIHISRSLVEWILHQDHDLRDAIAQIRAIKWQELNDSGNAQETQLCNWTFYLSWPRSLMGIGAVRKKGALSWLTCHPLSRHSFNLSEGQFRNSLCVCSTGCRSGYPHPANEARLSLSHMLCHVYLGVSTNFAIMKSRTSLLGSSSNYQPNCTFIALLVPVFMFKDRSLIKKLQTNFYALLPHQGPWMSRIGQNSQLSMC